MICKHQNAKEFRRFDSSVLYQCQECNLVFIDEKKEKEEQIKAQIAAKLYQAESSGDSDAIKKWLAEYAELIK